MDSKWVVTTFPHFSRKHIGGFSKNNLVRYREPIPYCGLPDLYCQYSFFLIFVCKYTYMYVYIYIYIYIYIYQVLILIYIYIYIYIQYWYRIPIPNWMYLIKNTLMRFWDFQKFNGSNVMYKVDQKVVHHRGPIIELSSRPKKCPSKRKLVPRNMVTSILVQTSVSNTLSNVLEHSRTVVTQSWPVVTQSWPVVTPLWVCLSLRWTQFGTWPDFPDFPENT